MDANSLEAKETVPASRKLGREEAKSMLEDASRLLVAKGKKLREWKPVSADDDEALAAMLGPTGNLRAPTMRVGKTILVGFNDEMFEKIFG
jgi:arsenate reductase-like glutaredoxin family protein